MFKNLPKVMLVMCMVVGLILLTCGFTNSKVKPNLLKFIGKDNTAITLLADKQDYMQDELVTVNEKENGELKVGQVIVSNGVEEIIFAIGSDGSYITIPASK